MQPKYRVATQSHANRYTHSFCMVSMTAGATVSTLTSRDLSRFDGSDFGPEWLRYNQAYYLIEEAALSLSIQSRYKGIYAGEGATIKPSQWQRLQIIYELQSYVHTFRCLACTAKRTVFFISGSQVSLSPLSIRSTIDRSSSLRIPTKSRTINGKKLPSSSPLLCLPLLSLFFSFFFNKRILILGEDR